MAGKKTIGSFAVDCANIARPRTCFLERQVHAPYSSTRIFFRSGPEYSKRSRSINRWRKGPRGSMPICVRQSVWANHRERLSLSAVLSAATSAFHLATFDLREIPHSEFYTFVSLQSANRTAQFSREIMKVRCNRKPNPGNETIVRLTRPSFSIMGLCTHKQNDQIGTVIKMRELQ